MRIPSQKPITAVTEGIGSMTVTEPPKLYSDRFKQRTEPVAKPTVSATSLSDFPSLKKNTVITAPIATKTNWAHTVKTAIVQEEAAAAEAKALALLEAERQKSEAFRCQSYMPSRTVTTQVTKGYEEDYEEEDYREVAEHKDLLGGGTPPYGNRGFEEEDDTW